MAVHWGLFQWGPYDRFCAAFIVTLVPRQSGLTCPARPHPRNALSLRGPARIVGKTRNKSKPPTTSAALPSAEEARKSLSTAM